MYPNLNVEFIIWITLFLKQLTVLLPLTNTTLLILNTFPKICLTTMPGLNSRTPITNILPTQSSYYYEYDSKIINEDGSVLQTIDGARYIYVNQTDDNTYKLFAYCYNYSVFPETVWTNIYNFPGTPVVSAYLQIEDSNILLNAFPNPATQTVKVAYLLPENVDDGKLHLFDNNGKEINQFIIDNHTDFLSLDVSQFNSGVYHYFIEYGNTRTPSKKLVIR